MTSHDTKGVKKKYIQEKKKWVTEEEHEKYISLKTPKGCRGDKEHDFVLMLPDHTAKWDGKSPYNAQAYYDAMEDIRAFKEKKRTELAALGIIVQKPWSSDWKKYVCSVCNKQAYNIKE